MENSKIEVKKTKKREKVIIKYEDGTTEEFKSAVVFALEEHKDHNSMMAYHCNTKDHMETFIEGMSRIMLAMLENNPYNEVDKDLN